MEAQYLSSRLSVTRNFSVRKREKEGHNTRACMGKGAEEERERARKEWVGGRVESKMGCTDEGRQRCAPLGDI